MTELEAAQQYSCDLRELDKKNVYDDIEVDSARIVGFKAGARWQSKQSPWINVEERYPLDYDNKLIRLTDGTIRLALFDSDDEGSFWNDEYASESFALNDVTHWMPIPE